MCLMLFLPCYDQRTKFYRHKLDVLTFQKDIVWWDCKAKVVFYLIPFNRFLLLIFFKRRKAHFRPFFFLVCSIICSVNDANLLSFFFPHLLLFLDVNIVSVRCSCGVEAIVKLRCALISGGIEHTFQPICFQFHLLLTPYDYWLINPSSCKTVK